MSLDAATGAQPLLFDSLPEAEPKPGRRRAKRVRAAAESVAVDSVQEPVPAPPPPLMAAAPTPAAPAPVVRVEMAPFDPAALTNPELRALAQALPDLRLGHLLVEAAKEMKRRMVAPDDWDESEGGRAEPNPALLRAVRLAVSELSGDEV